MKLYKLTTQDWKTKNNTLWGEGVSHSATGRGGLCGPGWIHAYTHPLLAVFLNPIHAEIANPVLWECEGEIVKDDNGLKVGCRMLTTLRIIPLPKVTTEQRVKFAILCAMEVCKNLEWHEWAKRWLVGEDRSEKASRAAYMAAVTAEAAAYRTAEAGAAAYRAAEAAVYRTAATATAAAAEAAAYRIAVATAAAAAAAAAVEAAVGAAVAATSKPLDLIALADAALARW